MDQNLVCEYLGRCGGCPLGQLSISEQRHQKLQNIVAAFPGVPVRILSSPSQVRDRADLVWESDEQGQRIGLLELRDRRVLDLHACPMMSPRLESFFKEFRKIIPPIQRGSVRLRVAHEGRSPSFGAWLDFANLDVKNLFEEKSYLRRLSDLAFVEIGQRRKALIWEDGKPQLRDPELHPWFETYGVQETSIALYGPVGGFSQAGFAINRLLVNAVVQAACQLELENWVELFCGNGNLPWS
jgi:23S rRNA (uracil1939-C5)-methyltransferase